MARRNFLLQIFSADGNTRRHVTIDGDEFERVAVFGGKQHSLRFDAPDFGIRVDGLTLTGTVVQSYWTVHYTVTDVETARNTPWNANVMDMEKNYIDGGALGMGGGALPEYNSQQLTYTGAFKAMEQPPTELMILLRNWDDHSLNNYFPVTLK